MTDQRLHKINLVIGLLVITLGLYIAIKPVWPNISLFIAKYFDSTDGLVYQGDLSSGNDNPDLKPPPEGNQIVIPDIYVDEPVVVGDDPSNVHRGVWHRPNTSTPDKGGNSVFVGHRFSYSDPSVFYHLDKVEVNDEFAIWWEGKEYLYRVFEVITVPATAIEYEGTSNKPIATVYTCTPLWTAKDRLVVRGELIDKNQQDDS